MGKNYYIVTIARQFGSLGRPIARELSKLLNVEYYDRDILEMASKELNQSTTELNAFDEQSYRRMKYPLGLGNHDMQNKLFATQKCIISELAMKEQSCIIVGRCSDFILKDNPNVLNVYIYAPYEARLDNCINILGISPEEAPKMIRAVDKARSNFHRYYTNESIDTINNRHILIDSSVLGVEKTAKLLAEIVKDKFEHA